MRSLLSESMYSCVSRKTPHGKPFVVTISRAFTVLRLACSACLIALSANSSIRFCSSSIASLDTRTSLPCAFALSFMRFLSDFFGTVDLRRFCDCLAGFFLVFGRPTLLGLPGPFFFTDIIHTRFLVNSYYLAFLI